MRARTGVSAGERREELRLLVRAARHGRISGGHADRRQRNSARAAVRAIRHRGADFGDARGGRALRLFEAAAGRSAGERERVLPQEFDFHEQALLYIPPRAAGRARTRIFRERGAEEIARLLEISRGPRLLPVHQLRADERMFTSACAARVRFPLLLQGTAPRSILLDRFRVDAERRAVCHFELLAGRGRSRRAAFLRDHRQAAVCGAERSDCRGARAGSARGRPQSPSPNIRCPRRCWR